MRLLVFTILLLGLPHLLRIGLRLPADIRGVSRLLWWLDCLYCSFLHRLELPSGMAQLPDKGPALVVANHTSGIDSMLLQAGCDRRLGFMILQDWYDHWLVHRFCVLLGCIPVRRDGRDLSATRAALRALDSGRVVPIFPEGRIIPASGREFGAGKPGAAFIALHADAPVIPAYISGTPPTEDVRLSWITPSRSRVVFGPPIDLSPYRTPGKRLDKATIAQVSDVLMDAIRGLSEQYSPDGNAPPPS